MSAKDKKQVVYRFKAKVMGGDWRYVMDKNNIPVAITTDRGPNSVLYIFRSRYPSIADMYQLGETLIAEPDVEATKRLEEYKRQQEEEREEQIRNAWWQD